MSPTDDLTPDYVYYDMAVCIDGGGSKTLLQVIDAEGRFIKLFKDGIEDDKYLTTGSNINSIGIDGVRVVLANLGEVGVGPDRTPLKDLISKCAVVASFAGIGANTTHQTMVSLLREWGIPQLQMYVSSDADSAFGFLPKNGAILIAGTGSICLGKKDQTKFRVGGLGKILGDEGSGYQIGLQGIKAALAEEYGWGQHTKLSNEIRVFFDETNLKNLIGKISSGEITTQTIARLAPIVIRCAYTEKDEIARNIVNKCMHDLGDLLGTMIKVADLSDGQIHLHGGLFKSEFRDELIKELLENRLEGRSLEVINKSLENPTVSYARMLMSSLLTQPGEIKSA
jgi:N-acetylglucosamine kinase-like BadF-type ATPase